MEFAEPLCTILGYHEIGPRHAGARERFVVSPDVFERQVSTILASGGQCVPLDHVANALIDAAPLPKRAFALTFDDGYRGVFDHGLDIMHRHGCVSTVFVPSQLVGRRAGPHDPVPFDVMDIHQLRHFLAGGHTVGAHTRTHADLQRIDDGEMADEVAGSRDDLQRLVDVPVEAFCYPFGRYTDAAVTAVRHAGYRLACTTRHGAVSRGHDPFVLKRVMVRQEMDVADLVHWPVP
jgi:peptidoglycan/xylan/chitin deacetylase (PgdA/CDA1 family)